MDAFWKSALEAAEKAKTVARAVSQKGIEFAEATAEEAGKRLKDLNLQDTIPGAKPKEKPGPTSEELRAYGITPDYIDFIRTLNYTTFRDFTTSQAASGSAALAPGDTPAAEPPALNAWQVRHATLVVRAVKEVNELRYVLCPRYLTDQRFWEVYFTLARSHLPSAAFAWTDTDPLPPVAGFEGQDEAFMSFTGVGNQLKTLSGKLQAAAVAAAHVGAESTGVELATFLPLSGAHGTAAGTTGAGTSGGDGVDTDASSGAGAGSGGAMLQVDPDLEEYLRGAAGSDVDEVGSEEAVARVLGDGGEGEELDLDKYLKELSAEVADGEGGEGEGEGDSTDGVDVDAVLREMDLGDVDGGDDDDDEVNKIVAQAQDAAKLNVD